MRTSGTVMVTYPGSVHPDPWVNGVFVLIPRGLGPESLLTATGRARPQHAPPLPCLQAISHLQILVFQGVCLRFICQIICHINMVVFSLSVSCLLSVIPAFARQHGADRDPGPACSSFIHSFTHSPVYSTNVH